MSTSPAPIRRHRLRTGLLIAGGVFVIYVILGLIFGPGWARHRIERAFAENTNGTLSLGKIGVNPVLVSATLHDVRLTGAGGDSLFSVAALTVDLSLRSIFQRAAVFDHILIDAPAAWLVVGRDSTLHWAHLFKAGADTAHRAAEIPRIVVLHFRLRDGRVTFEDSTKRTPYRNQIRPLALELHDFSTLPTERGTHVVDAMFPRGGRLHWEGSLITRPFGADGHVAIDSLPLRSLWEYIKDDVSFGVLGGRLSMAADYRVRTAGDSAGTLLSGGRLAIADAALAAWGGDSALTTIPSLTVDGVRIDMAHFDARVEQVLWRGGHLRASLAPDTVLNLSHLFEPRGPAAKLPPPPGPAWHVRLDRFAIENASVGFEDSTQRPPVALDLDQVAFEVKGVDNGRDLSGTLATSFRLERSGQVQAAGRVAILPVRTDLTLKGSAIPLRPLQAYVDTFIKLDIVRGTGDLEGRMAMNELPGGLFSFRFTGDARLTDVIANDPVARDDFLRFRSVQLRRATLKLMPDSMRLASVEVREPRATIAMGTSASLNLFRIFPALQPPPPGTEVPATPFAIDRIRVQDGTLNFEDRTLQPPFRTRFTAVSGEITHLSTDSTAEAQITLEGRSGGAGPLAIHARLKPAAKEPYAHFTLEFGGMDCLGLSPFTGKYLGRTVDRGQMGMHLGYDIENRKIKGSNKILLDKFYLGEKTDSPDATHLPVGLALALLRDKNGLIDMDIPVQGDLDDPRFKVTGVILHALLNLVTKAAMSPFSLLGHLFGGGSSEDLGRIAFDPGADSLSRASLEQLGQLAKAAAERPALKLNVSGGVDSVADRAALASVALEQRLASERRAEYFAARVAEPDRAAAAPWPAGERDRILAKLYLKDFGADTLGARFPNPNRSAGDLKRIGSACERGIDPRVAPVKGADRVPMDAWRNAEARLLAGTVVDRETMLHLAGTRAEGIRAALVGTLGVGDDRVFLRPPTWHPAAEGRVPSTLELSGD